MPFWLSRAAQNFLRTKRRLLGGQSDDDNRPSSPGVLTTGFLLESLSDGDDWWCVVSKSSLHRSCVAHAVLGSEEACWHSLPPEIQMKTFAKLDALSLCRIAQASKACRALAEDPLVWERSPCGHRKDVVRQQHLYAAQLRALQLEAEERERRRRWQRHKRRALSMLQHLCGMLLVLLPVALCGAKRQSRSEATVSTVGPADLKALPDSGALEHIVWAAVSCGSASRSGGSVASRT